MSSFPSFTHPFFELVDHRADNRRCYFCAIADIFLCTLLPCMVQKLDACCLVSPVESGERGIESKFTIFEASIC